MYSSHLSIVIEPLSEYDDGGFLATVPELPGCMSDGATYAEALENAQDAIEAWIDQATAMGRPVPTLPGRAYVLESPAR